MKSAPMSRGRFVLLSSGGLNLRIPAVQIGEPFYGGRTDLVTQDVALDAAGLTRQSSALATLTDKPLAQSPEPTAQLRPDELLPDPTLIPALRVLPGTFVVQQGGEGATATLLLRGGEIDRTEIDGVPAEDLGGHFDFSRLATAGFAALTTAPALDLIAGAQPLQTLDADGGSRLTPHCTRPNVSPRPDLHG